MGNLTKADTERRDGDRPKTRLSPTTVYRRGQRPFHVDTSTKNDERPVSESGVPQLRFHDLRYSFVTLRLSPDEHP
jgi:hypothetical protein